MPVELGIFAFGVGVGIFSAYLGLGGGLLVVPFLTLVLNLPAKVAVGTSLLTVITTSTGAAQEYLKSGRADVRLGIVLELFTTTGALAGGLAAVLLSEKSVFAAFGLLLVVVAFQMLRSKERADFNERASIGAYRNWGWGAGVSSLAGVLSGVLGVGGGVLKIPAMNLIMKVPLAVAFATSNLMIGVTATAGALVYFSRGDIDLPTAAPLVLGTALGAFLGAKTVHRVPTRWLRLAFVFVLLLVAFKMLLKGLK
ncbi:MAG: sulfite exporter TauE/SafE family protein [candidate division Zixibacteria bacterium]|nr:sulfite exporter TauE/SafE family protein [candidate division Zixibacteria bacterium]